VAEVFGDDSQLVAELQDILLEHKVRALRLGNDRDRAGTAESLVPTRVRRDMPTIHMQKGKKKLRTCANMNGILGLSSIN
jgi:hypothetical protein